MVSKTRDKLQPLQIQRWCRAVESGQVPIDKDPITGELHVLPLPLAKADGNGLTFTLSSAGTASWVLRYRRGGRSKELTLGNYPDIGLADARKMAREKRSEIDRGGDPAAEKRKFVQEMRRDWTVRELIADYEELVLSGLGTSTQRSYGRNLKRVESRIGGHLVSDVTSLDIVDTIEATGTTWTECNMLLVAAKMLFRHAVGKKLIALNPCIGIELNALLGKRPPIRKRLMLSAAELHELMNADMNRENLLAIKILLGTAVRSDELFSAEKSHFDLNAGIWSIPSSKTGPGTQVPLTELVQGWIKQLMGMSGTSKYLLPARSLARHERAGGDAQINPNTIGAAIDYWFEYAKPKVNARRFTPHDLRSTAFMTCIPILRSEKTLWISGQVFLKK
jgi:integrase